MRPAVKSAITSSGNFCSPQQLCNYRNSTTVSNAQNWLSASIGGDADHWGKVGACVWTYWFKDQMTTFRHWGNRTFLTYWYKFPNLQVIQEVATCRYRQKEGNMMERQELYSVRAREH